MRQRFLLFFLLSLQIPSILASHGCSLAKGDCTGRTSDDLLCPVLAKPCGWFKKQSECPSDCEWTKGYCSLNHADSVTYDNATNEVSGAVNKYKQSINCSTSVYDCGAECEKVFGSTSYSYCAPKMSIIKAKLEADGYQRAAIQEGYLYWAHEKKVCAGLNEAQCKATDAECQAYLSGSYTYCYVSDAYDLAVQANACPNTDFTARAAVLNMTMSQVYQKTGITPGNNLVTSAACDTSVNLFVLAALAVSVLAARF